MLFIISLLVRNLSFKSQQAGSLTPLPTPCPGPPKKQFKKKPPNQGRKFFIIEKKKKSREVDDVFEHTDPWLGSANLCISLRHLPFVTRPCKVTQLPRWACPQNQGLCLPWGCQPFLAALTFSHVRILLFRPSSF